MSEIWEDHRISYLERFETERLRSKPVKGALEHCPEDLLVEDKVLL